MEGSMTESLQWYRVEIDAAGKTLSLRAVDAPATTAGGVFRMLVESRRELTW
jgi:hypothetical protein